MSNLLDRLGRACARHPWRILALWLLGLVAVGALARASGGEFADNFRLPDSDAQEAADILDESFPSHAGGSATVVFAAPDDDLTDPDDTRAMQAAMRRVSELDDVVGTTDPAVPGAVSDSGRIARSEVRYGPSTSEVGNAGFVDLDQALDGARDAGLKAEVGGPLAGFERAEGPAAEQIGLLIAVVVLVLAFGSVMATVLPIGIALLAVTAGLSLVTVLAAATEVPNSAESIGLMIGLGVGIDYAVFVLSRFRDERRAGAGIVDAVGTASGTAGLAVLFAGSTVIVAISGLWLSGIVAIGMLGLAVVTVVAVTMLAAFTVLPALLGLLGRWVGPRHASSARRARRRTMSEHWATAVVHRPVRSVLAALVILLVLGAPVAGLRLGQTDAGTEAEDRTHRRAFDLQAEGFGPGFNGPLTLVVEGPTVTDPSATSRLSQAVGADPGVAAVAPPVLNDDGTVAVLEAFPTSAPHAEETAETVDRLRERVIPAATAEEGIDVLITGPTAGFVDLAERMEQRLPVLIGAVVAVSFVLLMIAFRSLLIPLKAAIINVLSIGVGYGVVVAVFQWGWGKELVGLPETVPVVAWVPLLMFAILFGLSMDYEVFLISAIREAHRRTGDTRQAVTEGLARTARVITAAAVIMMAVFGAFVADSSPVVKMIGLGLAVSVFIDATIVRMLLVPGSIVLLGRANWWLPRWLAWLLPTIDLEGKPTTSPRPVDLPGRRPVVTAGRGYSNGNGRREPVLTRGGDGR